MSLTDEEIAAAIAALASPELRARDDAAARLETGGWRAAVQLLDASRGSRTMTGTARARALFTFVALTYLEQIRRVRDPVKPRELRLRGSVGDVLDTLRSLVELEIQPDPELLALPVALERTCPSTLAALDLLSSAIGARWQQDEFGAVRLRAGAEPAYPTAYADDLRVSVLSGQTTRRTNFRDLDVSVQFGLEVLIERPLLPLGSFALHVVEAVADDGRSLPATVSLRRDDDHVADFAITLADVSPRCRRVDHLRVTVDAMFPETHELLRLTDVRPGSTVTGALCEFEVVATTPDSLRFVSRPSSSAAPYPPTILARLVDAAFLAVADDEDELAAVESFRPAGVKDEVFWELRWKRLSTTRIRELRIRAARSLWVRSTPLDVRDVPIP